MTCTKFLVLSQAQSQNVLSPGYQTFQLAQYSLQTQTHISNDWKYVCVYRQPVVNRQPLNPKSAIYTPK